MSQPSPTPPAVPPAAAAPPASAIPPDPRSVTGRQLLAWMFRFLRPVKWQVVVAALYLAAVCGVEILTVNQSGRAVDDIKALALGEADARAADAAKVAAGTAAAARPPATFTEWLSAPDPASARLRQTLLVFVVLTAVLLLLRYATTVSRTRMSMQMVYYIREAVYDKLQRVGFGFHDAVSSGQLINRALSDLQNVRAFIETAVLLSLEIGLVVGGYIVLIAAKSPWLALLALVPLPVWTWYVLRFSRTIQPAAKAVMEAEDKNVSLITENIAGVHVVKAFATEAQEIAKYGANADDYFDRVRKRIRLFADFQPVIRSIATASYLLLFLAAGILIVRGSLSVGALLVLGGAMSQILARLQQVAVINEQYQNAMVSARRLYEVLYAPATIPEVPGARPLPPGPGAVRFEHVTFGYVPVVPMSEGDETAPGTKAAASAKGKPLPAVTGETSGGGGGVKDAPVATVPTVVKPVLHDVSFDVPGGSLVAIVGPTGAGKTTLVNLVSRFYDPQQGRVLIDGVDVREASLASLRTQVSFVFQETYLFSDTVAGNVAYGRPNVTAGDVEAAAHLAQAHEFIEQLPQGYKTLLGERGSSLSGGQRQRLAIARAIVTNPRVLILDDATAAVDPETEDLIRKAMRFVMKGRTTFVIAHRISTVKSADLVIVIENGRVTQTGTHEQLMRQDGHYRDIAAVQLHGDDVATDAEGQPASHMDRVKEPRRVEAATAGVEGHDSAGGEEAV
jgi:ATP-binding cassette subfamily B protein